MIPFRGLPNRTLFNDRLTIALAGARRYHQMVAVMLFDLDGFKEVNDTLGHKVGDALLKAVGDRLTQMLRQSDTIARMGGDEFFILLPVITDPVDTDLVAQKILGAFLELFEADGHRLRITCSLGVSVYPKDGGRLAGVGDEPSG
jgi:diguanylate cyclase (GGDEF)-like protein